LIVVTLGFNFIADALRDYYDPYHTIFTKFRKKKKKSQQDEVIQ